MVSRLYFRSILGAHCITEFKAKNRPPAVSTATSAPHEPNLHVVPVGFVEIGYKLTPCPLIPNLGTQWIRYRYGTFAMFPDLGNIKWFNTLPGRVRWVGYAPKPLETCLVRPGAGASSPETVMRFHSNRRRHESSQARLDQAHAPPTTPRRTSYLTHATTASTGRKRGREGCG